MQSPTVHSARRVNGIAGQFSISAVVSWPDERPRRVAFVGSEYGGPVFLCASSYVTPVDDPSRFGDFSSEPFAWVRAFYA